MNRSIGLLGIVAGMLLLGSCMTAIPSPPPRPYYEVSTRMDLAYGPLPAERGDLYMPKGADTPPPVVVVIHGGGWMTGDRSAASGLASLLAQKGIASFNIDYRLANAANPDTKWPAQIVDAQLAVRWLRAHAPQLGIDGSRIGATGDSAGAHLALLLGVLPGIVPGDQASLLPDQRPNVRAVADLFGPTDVAALPIWASGTYMALFGTHNPTPGDLAVMSPLVSITAHSAPVLIIQGQADDVVPPSQSARLREALQRHGVDVEWIGYAGGHGFQGLDGKAIYALQLQIADWFVRKLYH